MLQGLVKSKFRDRVDLKRVLLATRLSQIEKRFDLPTDGLCYTSGILRGQQSKAIPSQGLSSNIGGERRG